MDFSAFLLLGVFIAIGVMLVTVVHYLDQEDD